jgi:sulfite reductase (NADPH) flavoprotein alpha-component
MNPIPFIPETAPFTSEQRAWLNGFLAGLYAAPQLTQPAPVATPKTPLLIMFGSQTGSAEQLAKKIARDADKQGFGPTVLALDDFAKADLSKPQPVVIVTSTWGDGDLPDNAAAFWTFLSSETAPRFEHLHYSVLALGDSSYSDFCGAGKKIDARFEHLGAKRFQPRTDCDKEYESAAHAWIESLWPALKNLGTSTASAPPALNVSSSVVVAEPASSKSPGKPAYSKSNPFPARLVANRKLN